MSKVKITAAPAIPAHVMPAAEEQDIYAIKALLAGTASADQQIRFLQWFNKVTGVDQNPYRPGGQEAQRDTDLACGRKLVGDWFYSLAKTFINHQQQ